MFEDCILIPPVSLIVVKNAFQKIIVIFNIIIIFFILVVFCMTIAKAPCTIAYSSIYLKVGDWEIIFVLLFFL